MYSLLLYSLNDICVEIRSRQVGCNKREMLCCSAWQYTAAPLRYELLATSLRVRWTQRKLTKRRKRGTNGWTTTAASSFVFSIAAASTRVTYQCSLLKLRASSAGACCLANKPMFLDPHLSIPVVQRFSQLLAVVQQTNAIFISTSDLFVKDFAECESSCLAAISYSIHVRSCFRRKRLLIQRILFKNYAHAYRHRR